MGHVPRVAPDVRHSFNAAGMNVQHLKALLEHAGLDMVQPCAQVVGDDLRQAHPEHSPIDRL